MDIRILLKAGQNLDQLSYYSLNGAEWDTQYTGGAKLKLIYIYAFYYFIYIFTIIYP